MKNFLVFMIAYFLFLPVTLLNFLLVKNKSGYFLDSAKRLDMYSNAEFRTLWNAILKTNNGYSFGKHNETISSALGKNQRKNTLTKYGKILVWILNKIDANHCENSIDENV